MEEKDMDKGGLRNEGGEREEGELEGGDYAARFLFHTRRRCSRLGFSLALIAAVSFLSAALWGAALVPLSGSRSAAGKWLADWLIYRGAAVAAASLSAYLVSLPLASLLLRPFPPAEPVKLKMRAGKFLMFFVLAMGLGYVGSFAGNALNLAASSLTGKPAELMNPVNSLMSMLSWPNILYIAVLGPVIEEWVFRKMLLDRVRFLGDGGAIVFTAVLFGLMHGNVSQTIFAALIGIILGYVAVKTGRIFYNSLLHILINSYSVVVALLGIYVQEGGHGLFRLYALLALSVMGLSVFAFIIAAVVILIVRWNKAVLRKGKAPEGIGKGRLYRAVYLNPGVICMCLYCVWQSANYLLP